jgi:putative Mg2+ transporter-C (MgtC) family protein
MLIDVRKRSRLNAAAMSAAKLTFAMLLLRLGSALTGGLFIGAERQWRLRTAGLRTHGLVAVGSALFVMLAPLASEPDQYAHLAGQVISGVGFLGAGVLMRTGLTIHGLNTAGTIWCSAAVGVLAGSGAHAAAYAGTVIVLMINTLLRPLSDWLTRRSHPSVSEHEVEYLLQVVCRNRQESAVRTLVIQLITASPPLVMHEIESVVEQGDRITVIKARLSTGERADAQIEQVASRLSLEREVTGVSWQATSKTE